MGPVQKNQTTSKHSPDPLQLNGSKSKIHCKAKAIGSNPLAGFEIQTPCSAVLAMGLGDWGKLLKARGLITG